MAVTQIFGDVFTLDDGLELFGDVFAVSEVGPFCFDRTEIYLPGSEHRQIYVPGAVSRAYKPGTERTEVCT